MKDNIDIKIYRGSTEQAWPSDNETDLIPVNRKNWIEKASDWVAQGTKSGSKICLLKESLWTEIPSH